jgi:hypothetical protein
MSVEGVTDAAARVVALAPGITAAYSSASSGQPDVKLIPTDLPLSPCAIVRHNRFDLAAAGSPERLVHYIDVEVFVPAANVGSAEKILLPLVTGVIGAFRTHVGLFGNATLAKVDSGGPPDDQVVNGKPYLVYQITVRVTEQSVQTYAL